MCAIVGSFNKDKLIELIELNSYRGSHSYSFSTFDVESGTMVVRQKALGAINYDHINIPTNHHYAVVHIQAPTTEAKNTSTIHPAEEEDTLLWHNGIVKANHVKVLQSRFGNDTGWDTKLLLRAVNYSKDELNRVDGSFSCLWYACGGMYLFRNSISPMFYDANLNISSTKFEDSISTPANKILHMDFKTGALYNRYDFATVENPYFFGDEI